MLNNLNTLYLNKKNILDHLYKMFFKLLFSKNLLFLIKLSLLKKFQVRYKIIILLYKFIIIEINTLF